jgi:hypothetical protein
VAAGGGPAQRLGRRAGGGVHRGAGWTTCRRRMRSVAAASVSAVTTSTTCSGRRACPAGRRWTGRRGELRGGGGEVAARLNRRASAKPSSRRKTNRRWTTQCRTSAVAYDHGTAISSCTLVLSRANAGDPVTSATGCSPSRHDFVSTHGSALGGVSPRLRPWGSRSTSTRRSRIVTWGLPRTVTGEHDRQRPGTRPQRRCGSVTIPAPPTGPRPTRPFSASGSGVDLWAPGCPQHAALPMRKCLGKREGQGEAALVRPCLPALVSRPSASAAPSFNDARTAETRAVDSLVPLAPAASPLRVPAASW